MDNFTNFLDMLIISQRLFRLQGKRAHTEKKVRFKPNEKQEHPLVKGPKVSEGWRNDYASCSVKLLENMNNKGGKPFRQNVQYFKG